MKIKDEQELFFCDEREEIFATKRSVDIFEDDELHKKF
jgi:hypothetical protein